MQAAVEPPPAPMYCALFVSMSPKRGWAVSASGACLVAPAGPAPPPLLAAPRLVPMTRSVNCQTEKQQVLRGSSPGVEEIV